MSARLECPDVTLIAATSINCEATLRAIEASQAKVCFAACKLLTHQPPARVIPELEVVTIPRITSSEQYSRLVISRLVEHVDTSHCLIVQWDGYVIDPTRWDPHFLRYDYIGASWPHFKDGHDVGNGGFSLRSRRLLAACRSPQFSFSHPEDVAIGRKNRTLLEAQGMRFAPRALADGFSAERSSSPSVTFGFHGVWHMPHLIGPDRFWDVYCGLEDRSTIFHDQATIMRQMAKGPDGLKRCWRMGWDSLRQSRRRQKEKV